MSPNEFKDLDNKIIEELRKRLPDNDIKVVSDPFRGKMIGVSYEKGGNLFEVYQLNNDGNEASYKFLGSGQL